MHAPSSAKTTRAPATGRPRAAGWRRLAFPALAVALAVAPFLALEGALTVFGLGGPGEDDALVGFGSASRLFELEEDGQTYTTARSRQLFFGRQDFSREKSPGSFRIFGLGGSTVRGRPYETGSSFLKWLEIELNGRDGSRRYETINCGGLSYASYRLTLLLEEVLGYEPDLVIIATGHNEFLEDRSYESVKRRAPWLNWSLEKGSRLRTVTLARELLGVGGQAEDDERRFDPEVEARLDDASGYASYRRDDQWRRNVIEEYERSVRHLVATCREADVPLILVNLGENVRDCPPYKSEHKAGLPAGSLQRWQALFERAGRSEETNLAEALEVYREAEAIDDQYALLAFRIARVLDRLGRPEEARRHYVRAKELDICPLRMLEAMHERLKRLAEETGTPLVDAEALAARISPDGIPGNNCFMDHVHPTIGSHQRIALLLADRMESLGLVAPGGGWSDRDRRAAWRRHFLRLGPAFLANGRRRVGWLENWARRERLEGEAAPKDARGHLHLAQKALDWGEVNAAWEHFAFAIAAEPDRVGDVLAHALSLVEQGRNALALEVLAQLHREPAAAGIRPAIRLAYLAAALDGGEGEQAAGVYALYGKEIDGLLAAETPEDPLAAAARPWLEAMPELPERIAAEARPRAAGAQGDPFRLPEFLAGRSRKETERSDERAAVMALIDKAVARNPDNALLLLSRARMHFARQDYEQALADASRAIQLAPDGVDALKLRSILGMLLDRPEQALEDLERAIALEPGSVELLRMRAAAHERLGDREKSDADLREAERLSGGGAATD